MSNLSQELEREVHNINNKIKEGIELNDEEMLIMVLSGLLSEEQNE
ncbi:MAG: hypothetical protein ACO20H_00690 [Bacteriovoracaceae bacterium]